MVVAVTRKAIKNDPILSTREAAVLLDMAEGTLRWWRHRDEGPASFRVGGRVKYRLSTLQAYLKKQEQRTGRGETS